MKKIFLFLILCFTVLNLSAKHIIGGEMYYTYLGKGSSPNTSKYRITLRLFRDDHAPADAAAMPPDVYIGIFSNDTRQQFPSANAPYDVSMNGTGSVTVNPFSTCMVNRPNLSYQAATYSVEVDLPDNTSGYTASYQTCCRITPIDNISGNGNSGAGSTFSCEIPPTPDSSPQFTASIDAVCGGKGFDLQFTATDVDGDSLSYAFEGAYNGGSAQSATNINPAPPSYSYVSYRSPYSASQPLGVNASINPKTGVISGIAPPAGRYVVTVAVTSWRNGVKISTHRKDFIINVSDCDFATAQLFTKGTYCDGYDVQFENDDFSPQNKTFYWEFFDKDNNLITSSTDEKPLVTFADTGTYRYKLIVNRGDNCADSAENKIGLYPGFSPDFDFDGKCINAEVFFTDKSTAKYGNINSWKWDFGVLSRSNDTSAIKNPRYTYDQAQNYYVSLTVQSNLGCKATITDTIKMIEKPDFSVSNDTLICSIDTLQLSAFGTGSVKWTPNYNINNTTSFNPLVSPKQTTTYYAFYEESRGCDNLDSVVVNVVNEVSLQMPADTTICLTDSIFIKPKSDGLKYQWSPAYSILNSTEKDILVFPDASTNYILTASIGKCNVTKSIRVNTVPYPNAKATPDTALCLGQSIQLQATGGSMYEWQPALFLSDNRIPNPVATPSRTVQYTLRVSDSRGCPKPSYDTVLIHVNTPFVDAGPRDTAIVVEEPLQLNAIGNGEKFLWSPPVGLSSPDISNPVANLTRDQDYIVMLTTDGNCIAYDTISVKVYNLKPGFYVPNAFTPNNDGLNDVIRPIAFGLKTLRYFRIYNRLGQIVFNTQDFREGWDGTFKGAPQGAAAFAWTAEAIDYTGKLIQAKGTITLIR